MFRMCQKQRGFTLVEILVVIAIIAILMAIMVSAAQQSREASRRMQCQNNLRQIAIGMQNHHDSQGFFPPGWVSPAGWGWGAIILPQMEHEGVAKGLDVKHSQRVYYDPKPPAAGADGDISIPFYVCISDGPPRPNPNYGSGNGIGYQKANYVASHGDSPYIQQDTRGPRWHNGRSYIYTNDYTGIFGLESNTPLSSITDGATNTFLVGERALRDDGKKSKGAVWIRATNVAGTWTLGSAVVGTCGGRGSYATKLNSDQAGFWGFSSMHARRFTSGGANFAMADASVHFILDSIDYQVYKDLGNMHDGRQTIDFAGW